MIKQQFFLDDMEILRLYHNGFTDFPRDRKVEEREKIKGGVVKFKEYWVDDFKNEEIHYDDTVSGFLPSNHSKNPYSRFSTNYQEFITYEMDLIDQGQIKDINQFSQICEFVGKWSGYNLKNSPFSINNTILFTPTKVLMEASLNKDNDRILKINLLINDYEKMMCIGKFKRNANIIETRLMDISNGTASIEPQVDWDTVDLEIYAGEQLVYAYYDLSFIKSIHLNMGLTTKQVEMGLKRADKTVTLEQISSDEIVIGESTTSKEITTYNYQEQLLKGRLNSERKFEFLTKGQYERGLDIFKEIAATRNFDEMWVFDPYFISYETGGGKDRINDIMLVLGTNLNLKKNIVFEMKKEDSEAKDGEASVNDFKQAIQKTVADLQKKKIQLNFTFYGAKEHFHDRFIFLKNNYRIKAFLLGTSFNSFGDSYSTIIEIDPINGQMVFDTLMEDIVQHDETKKYEGLV